MWTLSQDWYGGRLERTYRPPDVDHLQQLLRGVGLTSAFWRLR